MPYFNRFNCLPALIQSVQGQTHEHWELVLVDDCSDDSLQVQALLETVTPDLKNALVSMWRF